MSIKLEGDYKKEINAWLFDGTKGVVQSGPFTGMLLLPDVVWDANSLSPMLLGCFEEELHQSLEDEIGRLLFLPNPKIVNVGCSEGYYAIGLARRLPKATIWAIDICDELLEVAKRAAVLNNVQDRVIFGDSLDVVFDAPDLIVMDCEGAEVEYLDLSIFPNLAKATIIVEIHNWPGKPRADTVLYERFVGTHSITEVIEGGRNPNRFERLIQAPSIIRWMAVCEYRPCFMDWFVMRPLRVCGGCTLCCKLEKITGELEKPRNTDCMHCDVGVGCKIYETRPKPCRNFPCLWLKAVDIPDSLRPDKIHLYATGKQGDGYLRVEVDPATPDAWRSGGGKELIERITKRGLHAVIHSDMQINFVKGEGVPTPEKIDLNWTL